MNCVFPEKSFKNFAKRSTFAWSKAASTSSSKHIGTGRTRKIANKQDKAINAFSPPENNEIFCTFLPGEPYERYMKDTTKIYKISNGEWYE